MREKLIFKVAQIDKYNWLSEFEVNKLMMNMNRHIKNPSELQHEECIIKKMEKNGQHLKIDEFVTSIMGERFGKIRFSAIVDALSDTICWEFKCTDELESDHLLQVIIYAWIWNMTCEGDRGIRIFKLMNIKTAEVLTLTYNKEIINKIIKMILLAKYTKLVVKTDAEFIEGCLHYCQLEQGNKFK